MDNKKITRLLTADEIEAKVNTVNSKGVALMLYKTARTDFTILDELYGPLGWQKRHWTDDAGFMWCEIAVRNPDTGEWIKKSDVGTEDNNAKTSSGYKDGDSNLSYKTKVSDSVKRAGFAWGIGVELYTSPFIWIPADKCSITTGKSGQPTCYDRFDVADIGYENRRITYLVIKNAKTGQIVYTFGKKEGQTAPAASVSDEQRARTMAVADLRKSLKAHGIPEAFFLGACKKSSFEDMSLEGLKKAATLDGLEKITDAYKRHMAKNGFLDTDDPDVQKALGHTPDSLLESVHAMLKLQDIDEAWVCGKYKVQTIEDLPEEALDRINCITTLLELKDEFTQWQVDHFVDIDGDFEVPFFTEEEAS